MINSLFDFSSESTLLYETSCKIKYKNEEYHGRAKIKFEFLPKDKILIYTEFDNPQVSSLIDKQDEITFFINNYKIDAYIISSQLQLQPVLSELKWISKNANLTLKLNKEKNTKYIIFHLFNFFNFIDYNKLIPLDNGGFKISETVFELKNYLVTIQSLQKTSENIKIIREKGISRITQVGRVEKKDGNNISIEEYKELEELIMYFFSFTKGSWINPSCSFGLDENNESTYYMLNTPRSEWKSLSSWFEPTHNSLNMQIMKNLFFLFAELWENEDWQETLKGVIYWFINANDGSRGVDTGLILAQTALEKLSFEYVVNNKKLLSTKGFKDIWASDKFRLLFSSLNIPLDIPSDLKILTKEAKQHNWLDAPHALTEIRNSLVHPEHKKHGKFDIYAYIEAHKLSLWYLEVSILAICKFDGIYSNRVKRGKIENVPYI